MKPIQPHSLLSICAAVLCLLATSVAWSDIAVIVHPSNSSTISEEDVSRIYLGKVKTFPDGSEVIPVELAEGDVLWEKFINQVLKKSNQQIKSYWAQLLFTGKGTPPKAIASGSELKRLVAQNPALIGYIDSSEVDSSVRVVLEIK